MLNIYFLREKYFRAQISLLHVCLHAIIPMYLVDRTFEES